MLLVKLSSVYHTNCKFCSSSEYFSISVSETAHNFSSLLYFCHQYGYTAVFILKTSLTRQNCKHTIHHLNQCCTNIVCQVTQATKICVVAPNVCGSSVWNLLYFTLLAPRILRWLPVFFGQFLNPCSKHFSHQYEWRGHSSLPEHFGIAETASTVYNYYISTGNISSLSISDKCLRKGVLWKVLIWGMTSADWQIHTNVLEKLAASIFRVVFVEQVIISMTSK
jgi:hypothetical protein